MASSISEAPERASRSGPIARPAGFPHLALVWLITFGVALAAIGARATYGARVTADEPQYLLTALSLAEDRDLDISDELADQRYLPFHEIPVDPQTIDLDGDGQRLSPHDPLLPLLLAPAMGLGGWVGAKLMLAAIAATTAAATLWLANRRLGIGVTTATVVTTGLFAAPPLTAYGTQVYPEMPAALVVVVALLGLIPSRDRTPADAIGTGHQALVVAAVVALPWLSVKYVPVAAVLAVALLAPLRLPGRRRRGLAVGGILALAGLTYLVAHQRIYGGWTVYAAGDHFVGGEFEVVGTEPDYVGRSRRLVGLLVDRRFGLIPWAPAYLLAVPALAALARRAAWPRALLGGTVAAGWAMATWVALTMHGWWWPGRQVVVVLPIVVLAVAGLVDGRPRLLAAVAGVSAAATTNWLWLAIEATTDRRTLIVDFYETSAPLYRLLAPVFPDHMTASGDPLLTAAWIAGLALLAAVGWRREADPTRNGVPWPR